MSMKKALSIFVAMLAAVTATTWAQQQAPYRVKAICGVVKSDAWLTDNTQEGIYELDLESGALTKLTEGKDVYQAPLGGAIYQDGTMKGIHFKTTYDPFDQANTYTLYHVEYDMKSWQRTYAYTLGDMDRNYISSCGLALDPVTGTAWGIFYNFNMSWQVVSRKLASISFATPVPTRTIIGNVTTPMAAIACSDQGVLYGIGQDGFLYAINTTPTGDTSSEAEVLPLGDLGIDNISTYPSSMTFNPFTGKFLWSVVLNDGKSYLYEVNHNIGQVAATKLMQVPDNAFLVNLYIPEAEAGDDAPAAVTDLNATFDGTATTGIVTFTMPTLSYTGDGLDADTPLTYTVTCGTDTLAQGTAMPGEQVTASVTVQPGEVTFTVTAANEAGASPATEFSLYVGPDVPLAPDNLAWDYDFDARQATVTWQAPQQGTHGIELNAQEMTFNIYLMPAGNLVAQDVTECQATIPFDPEVLAAYSFRVEPVCEGITGQSATTASAVVGPALDVPYTHSFNATSSFDLITVIDANGDGNSWYWDKGWSSNRAAIDAKQGTNDDWMLSPPLNLKKGATYRVTFNANTYVATNVDYLQLAYGKGFDTDAYTAIGDRYTISSPVSQDYTQTDIVPTASGPYYFGFHSTSIAPYGFLLMHNFSITMVKDAPQLLRGDVDGSGTVDIDDVSAIISIILGKATQADYPGSANVDDNGGIDIDDVSTTIRIILGKEQ